jgi:hypothetical protein
MASPATFRVRLLPWDDSGFVQSFERARAQAISEGLTMNGPKAAARVEQLIRADGFPNARVDCERTVEEALEHSAHWTVSRDT